MAHVLPSLLSSYTRKIIVSYLALIKQASLGWLRQGAALMLYPETRLGHKHNDRHTWYLAALHLFCLLLIRAPQFISQVLPVSL